MRLALIGVAVGAIIGGVNAGEDMGSNGDAGVPMVISALPENLPSVISSGPVDNGNSQSSQDHVIWSVDLPASLTITSTNTNDIQNLDSDWSYYVPLKPTKYYSDWGYGSQVPNQDRVSYWNVIPQSNNIPIIPAASNYPYPTTTQTSTWQQNWLQNNPPPTTLQTQRKGLPSTGTFTWTYTPKTSTGIPSYTPPTTPPTPAYITVKTDPTNPYNSPSYENNLRSYDDGYGNDLRRY